MTDGSPPVSKAVLQSLPARPLTLDEGDAVEATRSESVTVRPESLMLLNGDRVVVALAVFNQQTARLWGLGYSPRGGGWEVFGSWENVDLGTDAFYESLHEWEQTTYH